MRFFLGFVAGVVVCLLLGAIVLFLFTPSAIRSMALDGLATYREATLKADVEETEKQAAVASLDRMIERVRAREISFWEYSMATADIAPLVDDEVLTKDEWPRFAAEVRAAEIILVGSVPPQGPREDKESKAGPPRNR